MFSSTGDGPLREGLSRTLLEKDKEGLETITQNVTRTLLWSDNGKQLQCVANHYALTPGSEKSNFQLNVECKSSTLCCIYIFKSVVYN